MRVLLVEDNQDLSELLIEGLSAEGHIVDGVEDGEAALAVALAGAFDVIVLDLMLPTLSGVEVLRELRARGMTTPVVVLTAKDALDDRIELLDLGADDYLSKPFAFGELAARLRAVVRRKIASNDTNWVRVADLEINLLGREVRRAGKTIRLTAREFAVLECLALRRGRLVRRETLHELLYTAEGHPESNVIEVYIRQLRRKLNGAGQVDLIRTRRGEGYMLEDSAPTEG